jgi:hypothetical protein
MKVDYIAQEDKITVISNELASARDYHESQNAVIGYVVFNIQIIFKTYSNNEVKLKDSVRVNITIRVHRVSSTVFRPCIVQKLSCRSPLTCVLDNFGQSSFIYEIVAQLYIDIPIIPIRNSLSNRSSNLISLETLSGHGRKLSASRFPIAISIGVDRNRRSKW